MTNLTIEKYAPAKELAGHIKYYYLIKSEGAANLNLTNHPQGNFDLMFPLREGYEYRTLNKQCNQNDGIIISGQHENKFDFSFKKETLLLGVVFYAHTFYKFAPIPVSHFNNIALDVTDVINQDYIDLNQQLIESQLTEYHTHTLNTFFIKQLNKLNKKADYKLINMDKLIRYIVNKAGLISINELAFMANASERSLRRKVSEIIGISPKSYCKIIRFNHALNMLKNQQQLNWQDIMFECNYYDQNHFIKEFKQFTGKTPSTYYKTDHVLSDFFHKMNNSKEDENLFMSASEMDKTAR